MKQMRSESLFTTRTVLSLLSSIAFALSAMGCASPSMPHSLPPSAKAADLKLPSKPVVSTESVSTDSWTLVCSYLQNLQDELKVVLSTSEACSRLGLLPKK